MNVPVEQWLILMWDIVNNTWVIAEVLPHAQEEQARSQLARYRETVLAVRLVHTADGM